MLIQYRRYYGVSLQVKFSSFVTELLLRLVVWSLEPHHHDKAGIASGEIIITTKCYNEMNYVSRRKYIFKTLSET